MTINIDKSTLNKFSFLMAFYEHADRLTLDGVIKRKIVAPDFLSEKTLKERLSRVILKGLRSSDVYDTGEVMQGEDASVKIKSIARRLNRDFELERYMQFVLEVECESASDNVVNIVDDRYELFPIEHEEVKQELFKSLFAYKDEPEHDAITNHDLYVWLTENYEICASTKNVGRRSLGSNPLSGIISPDTDNLVLAYRDCKFDKFQEHIFESGSYYTSRLGRYRLARVLHEVFNGRPVIDCDRVRNNRFYNSGLIPISIQNGTVEDWEKYFANNFYLSVASDWNHDNQADGTLIFAKKVRGPNNAFTIIPNLVKSIARYELTFSKPILTDPTNFYTLNKSFMSTIRRHIIGETNDQT